MRDVLINHKNHCIFLKYRLGNNNYEIINKMKGDFITVLFI